jgi:hypothetical protein
MIARARLAIGTLLINLGARIMPPVPEMDPAQAERMRARIMARLALERMGDRRNGHHPYRTHTP